MSDDRDWTWLSRRGERIAAPTPAEAVLWILVKQERRAELRVRRHPHGQELRCTVNGSFLWSEVFKPGDGRQLGVIADEHKAAWVAKGWQAAE